MADQVLLDRRPIVLNATVIARPQADLNQGVLIMEIVTLQERQEQRLSVHIGGIVILQSQNGDLQARGRQARDRRPREVRRRRDGLGVRSMPPLVERGRGGRMRDVDFDE